MELIVSAHMVKLYFSNKPIERLGHSNFNFFLAFKKAKATANAMVFLEFNYSYSFHLPHDWNRAAAGVAAFAEREEQRTLFTVLDAFIAKRKFKSTLKTVLQDIE